MMPLARVVLRADTARVTASQTSRSNSSPRAAVLMVQGTASHAGKSTVVAALCRLFARSGYSVAPFKAQNMSNNAAVTADGREVGRAQAMQAIAARVPITVDMNPVLLKPQSDRTSQVVVLGTATHTYDARQYYDRTGELWPVVTGALDRLRAEHDVIVIEGAGSPAEINLDRYDIVNMRVARHAAAPVLLVGDIDRGGVFASLYGTWALLAETDRALIRGYVINKFRGDPSLLESGFTTLEARTGVPTLGVLPYLDLSHLPAEDGVEWAPPRVTDVGTLIRIAIMRLPRVANLDEFQPLIGESGVEVRWIGTAADLGDPDLIIVPGTKSTMGDLAWLRERGLDEVIRQRAAAGTPVLGICGGFQMLGTWITDEDAVEGGGSVPGLGLLPVRTTFGAVKQTRRVTVRVARDCALWSTSDACGPLDGYEIHMGCTTAEPGASLSMSPLDVDYRGRTEPEGCTSAEGKVVGTYVHGLLEHGSIRRAMLARLARRKGIAFPDTPALVTVDQMIDELADVVRDNLDVDAIGRMIGLSLERRLE